MKLLKHIEDRPVAENEKTWKREASRGVVFDKEGLMPLMFVSKFNYHKLPGGGIEKGETKIEACKREMLEETGCNVEIDGEIGMVTEFRPFFENLFQISYCFLGRVINKKGTSDLEQSEIDEGLELTWVGLPEAIDILKTDKPTNHEGEFILKRDLAFLEEAEKNIREV